MARTPIPVRPKKTRSPKKSAIINRPVADVSKTQAVSAELTTLNPDTGAAPKERLRDAAAAYNIFSILRRADEKSASNRAILQEMVDGAPPQSEAAMLAMGMGWVYNLNFLEADARLAAALMSYDDLSDSSDSLILAEAKPNLLSSDDEIEATDVIAEEHAKMVREQTSFFSDRTRLASEFCKHGVGFLTFPDADCPFAKPAGWDQVLIPRKTEASDEKIKVLLTQHPYSVDELYEKIRDPKYAAGWNVNEVRKAIVVAAKGRRAINRWANYWSQIEVELKNNDLGFGIGDCEQVMAVHYLIQEFDGSYSFYIGLEDGTNKEYLYKDVSRFKSANEAFISYTLGVGNGTFHSVRGLLWKLFPLIQASNRFLNKMLTNTDVAMTLLLQGDDGDSYDDLQITLGPAVGYLPPSAKVVVRDLPDVGTQGVPVIRQLNQAMLTGTGQFNQANSTSMGYDQKGNPETKYELQARHASQGSLTENAVKRFYRSDDCYWNEHFKRVQKIGPTGGKGAFGKVRYPMVKEFFERCKERGVTADFIINGIRKVYSVRTIGNGSPQMRLMALDELNQMAGSLDETGRDLAARDRIAMRFGRHAADRYKPKVKRIAPDATIAVIENAALKADDIPVLPDQNHNVHAGIHVPKFQEVIQQLVQTREQNPEADFRPLEPLLQYSLRLHQHASQHVAGMAANPLNEADMKSYRAALEQGGNLLAGFARELQQQERHAQDQANNLVPSDGGSPTAAAGGGEQGEQDAISASDPKLSLEIQRQQEELQQKRELHQKQLELASAKVAEVAQKMQLERIKLDNDIALQISKNKAGKQVTYRRDQSGQISGASIA